MRIRDSPWADVAANVMLPFLLKMILLTSIICLLSTSVFSFCRMSGNQMFPAVRDGDLCIFYRPKAYQIKDVVIYRTKNGERKLGRIIAVGGQQVEILEKGELLVNGQLPSEETPYPTYPSETEDISYPVEISEGEVFLLNDFRLDTTDSRENGSITQDALEGKLLFLLRRRGF